MPYVEKDKLGEIVRNTDSMIVRICPLKLIRI